MVTMPTRPEDLLVYVVDDDEAVRDSLTMLLESAGFQVEPFESATGALTRCHEQRPACILTDVRMPGMDGLAFQDKLKQDRIDAPVIIMTGHGDIPLAVRAIKAGAVDFIEKPFADATILDSIHAAVDRSQGIDPEIAARLADLTPREREVLELLVAGHPNKVVAYRLDISPRTVEIHRARVMEKMSAKSLPELVRMAIQAKIEPQY